ncbi:hypothetical protein GW17_00056743 [Ensete ventricosum]|nr:hypothetical protein GW17_00056743 [Ensete ventricosum]
MTSPQPRAEHKCPRVPRRGGSRSHKYHHCWRRCYPPPCQLLPFFPMDLPKGGQVEGGDAEGGCWPLVDGGAHRRRWSSRSSSKRGGAGAGLLSRGFSPARAETAEARRSGRTPGCTSAGEQGRVWSAAGLSSRGAFHKRCSLSVPIRQSPTHGAADNKD